MQLLRAYDFPFISCFPQAWPSSPCPYVTVPLQVQEALQRASYSSNAQISSIFQVLPSKEMPPTYFKTNKFTSAFQEIVDAYG